MFSLALTDRTSDGTYDWLKNPWRRIFIIGSVILNIPENKRNAFFAAAVDHQFVVIVFLVVEGSGKLCTVQWCVRSDAKGKPFPRPWNQAL